MNGHPLAYLDNAATSQKPWQVLRALDHYWETENANVHRGVHHLSQVATRKYEEVRISVQTLVNAAESSEIIFTKGCTEGINLAAHALSERGSCAGTASVPDSWLHEGDEILVSEMEHHSNIVPWQMAASRTGSLVKTVPVTESGEIDLAAYSSLLKSGRVKVVAIVHVSNSLGTINPVKEMIADAHLVGALVLVDGAQAGPHMKIDVQDLDADFYTLSCHKMYAPTGVGVLYGKRSILEQLPAYQGGGDMIHVVDIGGGTTYAPLPAKFEAGTPNIAGVIGLGAAIDYLSAIGDGSLSESFRAIRAHESHLADQATHELIKISGLRVHGTSPQKAGIVAFTMQSAHPHDVGTILDSEGVAVRTGHHCCMPLMKRFGLSATTRASFAFYNNEDDVEALIRGVHRVQEMFG